MDDLHARGVVWVRVGGRRRGVLDAAGNITYILYYIMYDNFIFYTSFIIIKAQRGFGSLEGLTYGSTSFIIPQGDKRGTAYEFYDWTYDGEWRGTQLVNGLGLLTDGDYGPENFKLAYYAKSELAE